MTLFLLIDVVALGAANTSASPVKRDKRRVTKASVYLVKSPSFLASRVSKPVVRGEEVDVDVPSKAGWYMAQYGQQKGYLHQSYVADRAIAFQISAGSMKDESQISGNYNLAVGGFSEGAEGHLRNKNSGDAALKNGYQWIDAWLPAEYTERAAMPQDPEGLKAFVDAGKLREPSSVIEEDNQVLPAGEKAPASGSAK